VRSSVLASLLLVVSCSHARPESVATKQQAMVTTFGPLIQDRGYSGCVALPDGRTAILGGSDGTGAVFSTVEIFDGTTWKAAGALLEQRQYLAAAFVEAKGTILVHGGDGQSSAELYDPSTKTSKATTSSSKERHNHALVPISGGRIIAIGGKSGAGSESSTEIFDPKTATWTAGPDMSIPRGWPTAVRLSDGRVLIVDNAASTTAEVLSADGSRFTATKPMKTPRAHPGLGLLGDGKVVAAGGSGAGGMDLTSSELWDPSTNAWSAGPDSATARFQPMMVSLASGSVLLLGGTGVGNDLERLDPGGAAWVNLGMLADRHEEGGCAGKVEGGGFIAGGNYAGVVTEGWVGAAGGNGCKVDGDCASGKCMSGTCAAAPPKDAGTDSPTDASSAAPPPITASFQRCTKSSECTTGHCVDGICCDTACNETCHSCVLPGSVGTCAPEPPGVDLRQECGIAASCSATCNGSGGCVGATAGTQCAPSKCVSPSSGVGPTLCVEAGARCPSDVAVAFDCAPYACEPAFGACRATCSQSTDCAGGFLCDTASRTCVTPAADTSDGGCSTARGERSSFGALVLLALFLGRTVRRR
jgi:hypothetical protein